MAVPKRKVSKAKRDSRRANSFKLKFSGVVECPQCHDFKLAHRVCNKCGYYKGKAVLDVAQA